MAQGAEGKYPWYTSAALYYNLDFDTSYSSIR